MPGAAATKKPPIDPVASQPRASLTVPLQRNGVARTNGSDTPPPLRTASQLKAMQSHKGKGKTNGQLSPLSAKKAVVSSASATSPSRLNTPAVAAASSSSSSSSVASSSRHATSESKTGSLSGKRPQNGQAQASSSSAANRSGGTRPSTDARSASIASHSRTPSHASLSSTPAGSVSASPARTSSPMSAAGLAAGLVLPAHAAWSGGAGAGAPWQGSNSAHLANLSAATASIPIPQGPALTMTGVTGAPGVGGEDEDASSRLGRRTPYPRAFQPRGVHRVRTDEFVSSRSGKRKEDWLERDRIQRRLEKLVAIHFPTPDDLAQQQHLQQLLEAESAGGPSIFGSLSRVRGRASSGFLGLGFGAAAQAAKEIREREQRVVPWQEDASVKTCPICGTTFSLAVRKHHCRLCGRVVCASPHLSGPSSLGPRPNPNSEAATLTTPRTSRKCSSLIVLASADALGNAPAPDPDGQPPNLRVRDARVGPLASLGLGSNDAKDIDPGVSEGSVEWERDKGIRICCECRDVVMRKQYMTDPGVLPRYLQTYDALTHLQKDIEQSLPEFQEMVLGLQKQDTASTLGSTSRASLALQRDAAAARKLLVANFANYDRLAKTIRDLPDERDEDEGGMRAVSSEGQSDMAQQRLQMAIYNRANLFLQQNMFPLQSLPKLDGRKKAHTNHLPLPPAINVSPTSTPASPRNPSALRAALRVLLEQHRNVSRFAAAANDARKLDDAKTLRASLVELEKEIGDIREQLRVLGVSEE